MIALPHAKTAFRRITWVSGIALLLGIPSVPPLAQSEYNVKDWYTKQEAMIPMRDGVKLFTIVYAPRNRCQSYPILLTRTAYGIAPYGPDNYRPIIGPNNEFAKDGYIVVYQDTRGKFRSEGEFIHHRPIVKGQALGNLVIFVSFVLKALRSDKSC